MSLIYVTLYNVGIGWSVYKCSNHSFGFMFFVPFCLHIVFLFEFKTGKGIFDWGTERKWRGVLVFFLDLVHHLFLCR